MHSQLEREGDTLISNQDLRLLRGLPLSERQRLIGLCADLSLSGSSSYHDPEGYGASPSGWVKIAELGERRDGREHSWWWRFDDQGGVRLHFAERPSEDEPSADHTTLASLSALIRSPEQATIRRLLLTEGAEVTLIDAPWGCGLTWGLAMAVADRLQEVEGELLMISRDPQRVRRLVSAISPEAVSRLHLITFEELYQRCFGQAPWPERLTRSELSAHVELISERLPEHPWRDALPLLKLLLEQPQARDAVLTQLDPLWGESATELIKQLESLCPPTAAPAAAEWPWLSLSCVVVDDALALPVGPMRAVLELANQALSDRRRGWRLVLAGREFGYPAQLSARWSDLERLCRSELNKHTLRHQMTQSERLSCGRLALMSALGDLDPRPWIERPRRQGLLELSHKPQHHDLGGRFSYLPISAPLTERELSDVYACMHGAPGGGVVNLSQRGHPPESLNSAPLRSTSCLGDALLGPQGAALGEPSTLVIYAPEGVHCSATGYQRLPPPLRELALTLDVQALRHLLSRTGGDVHLIASLPDELNEALMGSPHSVPCASASSLIQRANQRSPWGGSWAHELRAEARGLMASRDWAGALARWRAILPVAREVFGQAGYQEALSSLQALHSAAFGERLKARAWLEAATLYRSAPASISLELDDDQRLSLKVGVRALSAEAQEALHKGELDRLERALSQLDGLGELEVARPLYHELIRALCIWSADHLEAPVPQGPVQVILMSFLARQQASSVEHRCLLEAYEQRPEASVLCALAHKILSQGESPQQRWACRHLLRWARHLDRALSELISPPALSFELEIDARLLAEERLFKAALTLLFAARSAKLGAWVLSKRLVQEGIERPELSSLLGHLSAPHVTQEAGFAPPERLTQLTEALLGAWEQQGLHERRRALRALGDLKGLEESYQGEAPPLHLSATFELRRALERARGLWSCLTEAEREQLIRAWDSVQLASPNPRWGIDSLAPLEETLIASTDKRDA